MAGRYNDGGGYNNRDGGGRSGGYGGERHCISPVFYFMWIIEFW